MGMIGDSAKEGLKIMLTMFFAIFFIVLLLIIVYFVFTKYVGWEALIKWIITPAHS